MDTCKLALKVALCFIISRVLFFFMIQGNHGGLYVMLMGNLKDITTGWLILVGLYPCYLEMNKKQRVIIKYIFIYLVGFTILMLYPALPPTWFEALHIRLVLWTYNSFWLMASMVLLWRNKFA